MKPSRLIPVLILLIECAPLSLKAGAVVSLDDGLQQNGKVTLAATGIHVEGGTVHDIDLSNVLEADFSEEPFHLQYFESAVETAQQLPPNWTVKAIGPPDPFGSASYRDGELTLTGDGCATQDAHPDHYFFAGLPWSGDGQWTAFITETDAEVGFMLRDSLDEGAPMFAAGGGGYVHYGANYKGLAGDFPGWLRWTKYGNSIDTAYSADGKVWNVVSEDTTNSLSKAWLGFFLNSRQNNK